MSYRGQSSSPVVGRQAAAAQDASDGEISTQRSVREIREMLENSAFADSDNGRRMALGAARTALEAILREASPGPLDRGSGGRTVGGREDYGESTVRGRQEVRKVSELREAIRGAVNILSGIDG